MQEKELKFTRKNRVREAPDCPCGEPNNKTNPQFSPFEDCGGKHGYCHRCDRSFMPGDTKEVTYVYTPPAKEAQKFIPEQPWNWIFKDVVIDPKPEDPINIEGQHTVTFYYRNAKGKICTAKKMTYNFPAFKREHSIHPVFPYTRDSGYYPCIFYEHDLETYPNATVLLVESEKTAALLRYKFKAHLEEFIYLAVGGSNGLTDDKINCLKDRIVLVCYDCDNGEAQPDGSIKSPKGREAAQAAYLKIAPICQPTVIDIDPSNHDGLDLGDIVKKIDIEYIRALNTKEAAGVKIPDELITELRGLNKNGEAMTPELVEQLGQAYHINADKIVAMYKTIEKQYASETGITNAPLVPRIEHWMSEKFEFKRNIITSRLLMRAKGESTYGHCEVADIWRAIQHDVKKIHKKKKDAIIAEKNIRSILESNFVEKWNPILSYFESLPAWDGTDHITKLANHITTDDQEYWLQQFKKCLVRMIACTLEHKANRIIMTLVQETQESGKSSFIRFLCPPALEEYYKESPMDHDKDTEIALTENFIWNLEELADLNKKQISEMKAIVSMSTVKRRRSYGHNEETMRRIVNFWGSTNKNDFLADTQNSRWLCFNILNISHDYHNTRTNVRNVDINKVWGQAYHLYKNKFDYNLTDSERVKRDSRNQQFESMPEEKQMIIRYFKPARKVDPGARFMVNYEIKEHLNQHTSAKTRVNDHNIGRSMKQLGFVQEVQRYQGKPQRGYWVIAYSTAMGMDSDVQQPELFGPPDDDPIELPY